MSDDELACALKNYLGIFGGSGGPDMLSIAYQGSGLKIWEGWKSPNHPVDKPVFQGMATVRMARETYRIPDPTDTQMPLF